MSYEKQTMDDPSYESMINALKSFADNTEKTTGEMKSAIGLCAAALDSKDASTEKILQNAELIAAHYKELADEARTIADEMLEDLEKTKNEYNRIYV